MALPVLVETAAHVPAAIVPELTATSPRQKAPATRKAYKTDFRFFQEWCQSKGVSALPATRETVAAYLAAQAGALKASTIGRRVAAIRYAHKLAGLETPTDAEAIKATVRGIRRTFGTAKVKKAPAIAGRLIAMVSHAPDTLGGLRDRALLLVGFGGAFRRSALDVEDVTETETACASKSANRTDQESEGRTIAIARGDIACPAQALRAWLDAAGIKSGPVFRPVNKAGRPSQAPLTDKSVANIVKVYAERCGFDAATFAGHSLRAGFLTSSAAKGKSLFKMMDVSGHRSVDTLRGYVRDAELFKDHAGVGLL